MSKRVPMNNQKEMYSWTSNRKKMNNFQVLRRKVSSKMSNLQSKCPQEFPQILLFLRESTIFRIVPVLESGNLPVLGSSFQHLLPKLVFSGQRNILRRSYSVNFFVFLLIVSQIVDKISKFFVKKSKQVIQTAKYISRGLFPGEIFLKKIQKRQLGSECSNFRPKFSSGLSNQHSTQLED